MQSTEAAVLDVENHLRWGDGSIVKGTGFSATVLEVAWSRYIGISNESLINSRRLVDAKIAADLCKAGWQWSKQVETTLSPISSATLVSEKSLHHNLFRDIFCHVKSDSIHRKAAM